MIQMFRQLSCCADGKCMAGEIQAPWFEQKLHQQGTKLDGQLKLGVPIVQLNLAYRPCSIYVHAGVSHLVY